MKYIVPQYDNLRDLLSSPDRWQYLLQLANQISDARLDMLDVRKWKVRQHVYGITELGVVFNVSSVGQTPEEAVIDHWELITHPNYYFRVNAVDHFKWNDVSLAWERYQREHEFGPFARVL